MEINRKFIKGLAAVLGVASLGCDGNVNRNAQREIPGKVSGIVERVNYSGVPVDAYVKIESPAQYAGREARLVFTKDWNQNDGYTDYCGNVAQTLGTMAVTNGAYIAANLGVNPEISDPKYPMRRIDNVVSTNDIATVSGAHSYNLSNIGTNDTGYKLGEPNPYPSASTRRDGIKKY